MRVVIQRVSGACVTIVSCDNVAANGTREAEDAVNATANGTREAEDRKRSISQGFMVLLGICDDDTMEDVEWLVKKIIGLRVFDDDAGVMNRSIMDVGGEVLVVSQFTLYASYKKGNRPSWFRAGSHEHSIPLYEAFCARLSDEMGRKCATGEFGANMQVSLTNDGPVTICMDTKNKE